jgi:hypothetical protein
MICVKIKQSHQDFKPCGIFATRGRGKTLSLRFTEKMIQVFELDKDEADYFRLMVHLARSIAKDEKAFIKAQLSDLKKKHS